MKRIKITEQEAYELYDEMLNEMSPITIGSLTYDTSLVLKKVDPIAYRCGYSDYIDSLIEDYIIEGYNDDKVHLCEACSIQYQEEDSNSTTPELFCSLTCEHWDTPYKDTK